MKIAILQSSYEGSDSPFSQLDPPCNPARYLPEHESVSIGIRKRTAVPQIIELARQGFSAVINLCDGSWHSDTAGIEVVNTLERLNLPFTGAGAAFYEPSREAMKMACHSVGVRFPAYVMATGSADIDRAAASLKFPLIVKHPLGYSSVGLTPASRVTTPEDLRREAAKTIEAFGAALIEEFIEGREFTVLVAESRHPGELAWALRPIEFLFPAGESFKHFDLKWKDYAGMDAVPVDDPALAARLGDLSARAFAALDGSGYGRCDFRMDAAGELYFLEINPNCGIFYPDGEFGSADFILANDPAGHRGFLLHLLDCALLRRDRRARPWELRYTANLGFGLFAKQPIAARQTVERYEEKPHTLVSRAHVDRHWRGHRRRWFDQYAWPLSDNLHVMWSANPDDWRPINHSCDPNTWLEGLDLVARRDIAPGEELTVDYATFCGPAMEPFPCACGSADCRHVILGTDFRLPAIRARYGHHVSDYVHNQLAAEELDWQANYLVRPNGFGLSLVAQKQWRAGESLTAITWANPHTEPSVHSLQTGPHSHAEPRPFELRYVNHSCHPNVLFDIDASTLRALRDIAPGEELHYFYPATEWDMAAPFDCRCGTPQCIGRIRGAAHLPAEVLARYETAGVVKARLTSAERS